MRDTSSVRALCGLALAGDTEDRHDEANDLWQSAPPASPADAITHLEFASSRLSLAEEAEEDVERRASLARLARKHHVASWKLDPSVPETYAAYGSTYLLPGQDAKKGLKTLRHAHELLPSSQQARLLLAKIHVETGNRELARKLALSLLATFHGDEVDEGIAQILEATGGVPGAEGGG